MKTIKDLKIDDVVYLVGNEAVSLSDIKKAGIIKLSKTDIIITEYSHRAIEIKDTSINSFDATEYTKGYLEEKHAIMVMISNIKEATKDKANSIQTAISEITSLHQNYLDALEKLGLLQSMDDLPF